MATLQDTVRTVVDELIDNDELFTALDVSNKVKSQLPNARHREVRDVVRNIFTTEIATKGYARSPITVTLDNGTTADALLYHPVSASWDLDNLYDQQKRQQKSFNPVAAAAAAVSAASATPTAPLSSTATATVIAPMPGAASVTLSATTPVPMPTARDLWNQLFATQPSLFPTK